MSILCAGEMTADIVVRPIPDLADMPDSIIVDEIGIVNGGDALNTAVNLGRHGHKVYFGGRAGSDSLGRQIVDLAKEAGVCTDYVRFSKDEATSRVVALIRNDGARNFLHCPGANREFCVEDISLEAIKLCGHFHIGGTFHLPAFDGAGAAQALKTAGEYGLTTSMDVAYDHSGRWLDIISCCMPYLDYFLPSIGEAECMLHTTNPAEIAAAFRNLGVKNIIIKMGENGVYCSPENGQPFTCGSYHVNAVDTTGAGDAFVGGFIGALDDGGDLLTCVLRGTANAAFAVQKVGATAGIPNKTTLLNFINSTERPLVKYE